MLHEIPEGFPNSFLEKDLLSLVCVKCRPSVGAHAQGFKDSALCSQRLICASVNMLVRTERGVARATVSEWAAEPPVWLVSPLLSRAWLCRPRKTPVTCSPVASPGAVRRCCFSGLAAQSVTQGRLEVEPLGPRPPRPCPRLPNPALSAEPPPRFTGMFRSWVHSRRQLISLPVEVGSASRL